MITEIKKQEQNFLKKEYISLRLWKGPIPEPLMNSLKSALWLMYEDSRVDHYLSRKGYVDHTWEQIILAANGQGDLFLALDKNTIEGFLIAAISKDIENEPTYVIKQAWVSPLLRRTKKVKEMLRVILNHAKSNFCKHVLIVSSRNPEAYIRWLGPSWKKVSTILKGDL